MPHEYRLEYHEYYDTSHSRWIPFEFEVIKPIAALTVQCADEVVSLEFKPGFLHKLRATRKRLESELAQREHIIQEFEKLEHLVRETDAALARCRSDRDVQRIQEKCPLTYVRRYFEKTIDSEERIARYKTDIKACTDLAFKCDLVGILIKQELDRREELVEFVKQLVVSVHGGEALTWADPPVRRTTVGGSGTGKTTHARLSLPYKLGAIKSALTHGTEKPLQLVIVDADGATRSIVERCGVPQSHTFELGYLSNRGYGWQLSDDIESRDDARLMAEVLMGDYFPDSKDSGAGGHFRSVVRNVISGAIERKHWNGEPFDLADILVELRIRFADIVMQIDSLQGYERTSHAVRVQEQHGGDTEATLHNVIADLETIAVLWRHNIKKGRSFSIRRFFKRNGVLILPWAGYSETQGLKKINGAMMEFMIKVRKRERFGFDDPVTSLWIDIDELTNIGAIDEIIGLFSDGRKYGISSDFQYQDTARFEEVFNEHKLSSLLNSASHLAAFRCRGKTADTISNELGKHWVCRVKSVSYQKGNNLSNSESNALSRSIARMNQEAQGITHNTSETSNQSYSFGESTQENESVRQGTSISRTEGQARSFAKSHTETIGRTLSEQVGLSDTRGTSKTTTKGGGSTHTTGKSMSTSDTESWQKNWSSSVGGSSSQSDTTGRSTSYSPEEYFLFWRLDPEVTGTTSNSSSTSSSSQTWNETWGGSKGGSKTTQRGTNESWAEALNWSEALSETFSQAISKSTSSADNQQYSDGRTDTDSQNWSNTSGESQDFTQGSSRSQSINETRGTSLTTGQAYNVTQSRSETHNKGKTETFTCQVGESFSVNVTYEYTLEPIVFPHELSNLPVPREEGTLKGVFLYERSTVNHGRVEVKALDWERDVIAQLPQSDRLQMKDLFISKTEADRIYFASRGELKRKIQE